MRKNVVYAVKKPDINHLLFFYYKTDDSCKEIFTTRYRPGIYEYFRYGKSIEQLLSNKDWTRYPTVTRIVERKILRYSTITEKGGLYYGKRTDSRIDQADESSTKDF